MTSKLSSILALAVLIVLGASTGCGQSTSRIYQISKARSQGWLGVEVEDVTKRLKKREDLTVDRGAYVRNVVEDSPAEKAGLEEGDVILKFDDRTIDDSDDLTRAVRRTKPKTEVKIEVARSADRKTLTAKLGKVPAAEAFMFRFDDDFDRLLPLLRVAPDRNLRFRFFTGRLLYGLDVQDIGKQLGEYFEVPGGRGVLVTAVEEESDAAKAGFKAGDVITKVDNHSVRDVDDLMEELSDVDDKDVSFEIVRRGKTMTLTMHVDDEEDDDDYSYDIVVPRRIPHIESFRLESPHLREEMERLKEELNEMQFKLKDDLRGLKEKLRQTAGAWKEI